MKKIFFLVVCFIMTLTSQARSLVVVLSDGTTIYYLLGSEKNPVMTFTKDSITVDADKYTFTNVVKFYVSETDVPSAIESVQKKDLKYDGQTIYVGTAEKKVAVYSIDGKKIETDITVIDGTTAISTAKLKKGTYLVKVGETSLKFYKK